MYTAVQYEVQSTYPDPIFDVGCWVLDFGGYTATLVLSRRRKESQIHKREIAQGQARAHNR